MSEKWTNKESWSTDMSPTTIFSRCSTASHATDVQHGWEGGVPGVWDDGWVGGVLYRYPPQPLQDPDLVII